MKIESLVTEEVVSFKAKKQEKDRQNQMDQRQTDQASRIADQSKMFSQIDHAIAATIDFCLNERGMDEEEAQKIVYDYLSEQVMLHDASRGSI